MTEKTETLLEATEELRSLAAASRDLRHALHLCKHNGRYTQDYLRGITNYIESAVRYCADQLAQEVGKCEKN